MAFFEFKQNNSGGNFDISEVRGISISVIVEADDHTEANERAQSIGLYFDGTDDGSDCSCCGDRWYQMYNETGDSVPSHYGVPLADTDTETLNWAGEKPSVFVHLKDGRFFGFHLVDGRYVYKGDLDAIREALPSAAPKEMGA